MKAAMNISFQMGSLQFGAVVEREADEFAGLTPTVPVGQPGTLTTRTSDTAGVATLTDSGHPIEVGDTVDLYWSAGVRYGMDVDAVDAGAITISGGAGTVLPAQDTVVTAGQRVVLDLDFAGNDLVLFTINASGASHAQWLENGDVHILAKRLGTAEPWWWANDMGETNPLAAEAVGKLAVSTEATTVPTITVAILKDSS